MQKKKKWIKCRHRIVRNIAFAALYPYCKWKYGIKVDRFKEQGDRAYLILLNHQTAFDQFFVGLSFHGPIYYLASEDLFSKGWVSSLIRWLVAPIPIKKQTTDVKAVMSCIRVAKEGGTPCGLCRWAYAPLPCRDGPDYPCEKCIHGGCVCHSCRDYDKWLWRGMPEVKHESN